MAFPFAALRWSRGPRAPFGGPKRGFCASPICIWRSPSGSRGATAACCPPTRRARRSDGSPRRSTISIPTQVVCLGDSFDDSAGSAALLDTEAKALGALMAGRGWTWIAGNHDAAPLAFGGLPAGELVADPLVFRHEARADAVPGEISGHYHPKYRFSARGIQIARPCFVHDTRRIVLPAFGAFTGGLWADHPALAALLGPSARAPS